MGRGFVRVPLYKEDYWWCLERWPRAEGSCVRKIFCVINGRSYILALEVRPNVGVETHAIWRPLCDGVRNPSYQWDQVDEEITESLEGTLRFLPEWANGQLLIFLGYHNTIQKAGWLNNRSLFSSSSRSRKFNIKLLPVLASSEASLCGFRGLPLWLPPHIDFPCEEIPLVSLHVF